MGSKCEQLVLGLYGYGTEHSDVGSRDRMEGTSGVDRGDEKAAVCGLEEVHQGCHRG